MSLNSLKLPRQFGSGTEAVVLESAQLLIANNDSDGLYEEIPDAHVSLPYFKYFLMSVLLLCLPLHMDYEHTIAKSLILCSPN